MKNKKSAKEFFVVAALLVNMLVCIYYTRLLPIHFVGIISFIFLTYVWVYWKIEVRTWMVAVAVVLLLLCLCLLLLVTPFILYPFVNLLFFGILLLSLKRWKNINIAIGGFAFIFLLHFIANLLSFVSLLSLVVCVGFSVDRIFRNLNWKIALIATLTGVTISEAALRIIGWDDGYLEENGVPFFQSKDSEELEPLRLGEPSVSVMLHTTEYSVKRFHNKDGVIGEDHPMERKRSEIRWITAGDSYTENSSTSYETSWAEIVERNIDSLSNEHFVRINQAFGGSDPVFELYKYRKIFHKYDPDIVSLSINKSDVNDIISRGNYTDRYGISGDEWHPPKSPWWERFYGLSYIVRRVVHGITGMDRSFMKPGQRERKEKEAMNDLYDTLMMFQEIANEQGFEFFVIFHPLPDQFESAPPPEFGSLIERLKNTDIEVTNLLTCYREKGLNPDNVYKYYYPLDRHHTVAGNKLWAECLQEDMLIFYPDLLLSENDKQ